MFAPLPPTSFRTLQTRRLRNPVLAWPRADAVAHWFDPSQLHGTPHPEDPVGACVDESRLEFADFCSESCSMPDAGVQTKHARADAAPGASRWPLTEALLEALYADVFGRHLPFGAVPVLAVVAIGDTPSAAQGGRTPCPRGLVLRPFVPLPAHFMRSLRPSTAAQPASTGGAGWSSDALRTRSALSVLAASLEQALGLAAHGRDEWERIDAGLRELARRSAWQAAAACGKRLSHGRPHETAFTLDGAYLDFDEATHVPGYRGSRTPLAGPAGELRGPAHVLATWRRQIAKYHPRLPGHAGIVQPDELSAIHDRHLNERLAIEMAKMGGLTEDLATACPGDLRDAWLGSMRAIRMRGLERLEAHGVHREAAAQGSPAARRAGRGDLNAILAAAGQTRDGAAMDARLAPLLEDARLRARFVEAAMAVRRWLRSHVHGVDEGVDRYMALQAGRKNADMPDLRRDGAALGGMLPELVRQSDYDGACAAIDRIAASSSRVLSDLDPDLPGESGPAQMCLARAAGGAR